MKGSGLVTFKSILGKDFNLADLRQEIAGQDRKIIAFCHIHKTGGTSLEHMLRENFKESSFRVSTENELSDFRSLVSSGALSENGTYLVSGHRAHLAVPLLKQTAPTYPVTIFRRPLALFESWFSFAHTRQGDTTLTAEKAFEQIGKNRTARFLGGDTFEECLSNANRDYVFIGVTERLNEMAAVLTYLFGLEQKDYQSKNVTPPGNYVEFDVSMIEEFLRANELDRLIYDYFDSVSSRVYRQYLKVSDANAVTFSEGKHSFNKPIGPNFNLRENNDKFSLLQTGKELWSSDPEKGLKFFDKAFSKDWAISKKIVEFLLEADRDAAVAWTQQKIQELESDDSKRARSVQNRLRKWTAVA